MEGHISGIVDVPNACATLWLPTEIFEFDINPNANGPTKFLDGSIDLPIAPGDRATVQVELGKAVGMEPGVRFALREGGRTIGGLGQSVHLCLHLGTGVIVYGQLPVAKQLLLPNLPKWGFACGAVGCIRNGLAGSRPRLATPFIAPLVQLSLLVPLASPPAFRRHKPPLIQLRFFIGGVGAKWLVARNVPGTAGENGR